jgi:hypothetical protein
MLGPTILQIPWKKVKPYVNTPTWSKNSANSQCKAWICKKRFEDVLWLPDSTSNISISNLIYLHVLHKKLD